MAEAHSNYTRGEMEITAQKGTFGGFMNGTIYGGAVLVVILLFPILMFAVGVGWLPSLIATVIVGIALGLGLKLKGGWYAGLIAIAIVTGIASFLLTLIF